MLESDHQGFFKQCFSRDQLAAVIAAIDHARRVYASGREEQACGRALDGLLDRMEEADGVDADMAARRVMLAAACEDGLVKGLGDLREQAQVQLSGLS